MMSDKHSAYARECGGLWGAVIAAIAVAGTVVTVSAVAAWGAVAAVAAWRVRS